MKYYVAYKFLDADNGKLIKSLELLSSAIKSTGNDTFIFYRDVRNWGAIEMSVDEIITRAFSELKKCDALFVLVETDKKSEGQLLETGYAKVLNKKIILAIKKGINLRMLRSIADRVIEFDDMVELKRKISKTL